MSLVGSKRLNSVSMKNLEKSLASDNLLRYQTPCSLNHKRSKMDLTSSSEKKSVVQEEQEPALPSESASEDEKEAAEAIDHDDKRSVNSNRKKRGLKILSVKVQELVFKKQSTTYKDVANELIKQLRENKKKMQEITGLDESSDGEDEDFSEESPKKNP